MAMFHFRLKSDKKPNGTKISAVKPEKTPNALGGQNILLYKTNGFGLIRNTERGIEVTEKA